MAKYHVFKGAGDRSNYRAFTDDPSGIKLPLHPKGFSWVFDKTIDLEPGTPRIGESADSIIEAVKKKGYHTSKPKTSSKVSVVPNNVPAAPKRPRLKK